MLHDTVVIEGEVSLINQIDGDPDVCIGAGGGITPTGTKQISVTENGTVTEDVTNYASAKVTTNVPDKISTEDSVPYLFRQSGGGVRVGAKEEDTIVGGSIAWNQLVNPSHIAASTTKDGVTFINNGDGTVSVSGSASATTTLTIEQTLNIPTGHKILVDGCPEGGTTGTYRLSWIGTPTASCGENGIVQEVTGEKITWLQIVLINGTALTGTKVYKPQFFDLTAMFGTTVADYIYSLETGSAGAGVAYFRSLFPKPYYAYNAGELVHVSGLTSHDLVGFNQWDEQWEVGILNSNGTVGTGNRVVSKNFIPIIPNEKYCYSKSDTNDGRSAFYDANKNLIVYYVDFAYDRKYTVDDRSVLEFTTPQNACFMKFCTSTTYGTTYNSDISINLSSSENGTYKAYSKHSYALDSTLTLRGIPKVANSKMYFDGDTYASDGMVTRRYGIVDLGTLSWGKTTGGSSNDRYFSNSLNTVIKKTSANSAVANISCKEFVTASANNGFSGNVKNSITIDTSGAVSIYPTTNYTDASTFKTAMSSVYLVYELATPTTETATGYTNPQQVDADGTEEYVITTSANVAVPVGHVTKYPYYITSADNGKVVSDGKLVAQSSTSISANETVDTTYNNSVTVNVPNSYSASDEGKVVSNGALVAQSSDTVTTNDTYDTTLINSLTVNVSGGGGYTWNEVTMTSTFSNSSAAATKLFGSMTGKGGLAYIYGKNQSAFINNQLYELYSINAGLFQGGGCIRYRNGSFNASSVSTGIDVTCEVGDVYKVLLADI